MGLRILICSISLVLFGACEQYQTVYNEVEFAKQYSLEIPEYLSPTAGLYEGASAQYQSLDRELYFIAADEKKSFIENFDLHFTLQSYTQEVLKQSFITEIQYPIVGAAEEVSINGNSALITTIKGLFNERRLVYKFVIIETPKSFYQLILWTRRDKLEDNEMDIMRIIESFEEI